MENAIQGSQSTQVNQPSSTNNPYKYLFFITVFILLATVGAFYFVLNNKINQIKSDQITHKTSTEEITQTPTLTPQPTLNKQESTLTEYDSNYNLYTNHKFGFSLLVPKLALSSAECKKTADSYRPSSELTPITFFKNKDTIYLAADYFYHLTGEQKTPEGKSNFSGCEKLQTNFNLIENDKMSDIASLKIYTTNVKDDNSLGEYLKSKYGSGCKVGEKTQSSIADVYNVKILGDGKDLGESDCPINFMVDVKYNPTKGTVVIFELGQSCNLYQGQDCVDSKVVSSLKFL